MSLFLLLGQGSQSQGIAFTFMDAFGTNPVPAGVLATMTRAGTPTQTQYVGVGGSAVFNMSPSTIETPVYASATAIGGIAASISWIPSIPANGAILIFAVNSTNIPNAPSGVTQIDQVYDTIYSHYFTTYWAIADGVTNSYGFSSGGGGDIQVVGAYVVGWAPINSSPIDQHAMAYVSGVTETLVSPTLTPDVGYGLALSFFSYPVSGGDLTNIGGYQSSVYATGATYQVTSNFSTLKTAVSTFDSATITGASAYSATTILLAPLASAYALSFSGTFAPSEILTIEDPLSDQVYNVPNYQSPTYSQIGFANSQANRWVRGAFGAAARTHGGVAWNLAYGLSYSLFQLSVQIQEVILALRLPSSIGLSVDSWAADFFGQNLPRASGETDSAYIARITANLSAKKGLTSGVITVGNAYGITSVVEPWKASLTGGCDIPALACDMTVAEGCVGNQLPDVSVFVEVSSPMSTATQLQADSAILGAKAAGIKLAAFQVFNGEATPL